MSRGSLLLSSVASISRSLRRLGFSLGTVGSRFSRLQARTRRVNDGIRRRSQHDKDREGSLLQTELRRLRSRRSSVRVGVSRRRGGRRALLEHNIRMSARLRGLGTEESRIFGRARSVGGSLAETRGSGGSEIETFKRQVPTTLTRVERRNSGFNGPPVKPTNLRVGLLGDR